ncbi:TolC family protein [Stappia sp.]|uniref:TolC family protein n=1 Tax=Stappia sp. TaxID=1870903 RepID=UPI003A9940FD
MNRPRTARLAATIAGPLLLGGCVATASTDLYGPGDAGFSQVLGQVAPATGTARPAWVQNAEQARMVSDRVSKLVQGKTISAETAVQVALINNRGLQAAYSDLGISAADTWQQTLLPNPTVSVGLLGIGHPGLVAFRTIEGFVASNILALATHPKRSAIAETRFRQAQMQAAGETLRIAAETRQAWIEAVAAFEVVASLNQARQAADAASELAEKLGQSGAMPKAAQAREHAFYAELTGQIAEARLAAKLAKERLSRSMGLWGPDMKFFVPDALPALPGRLMKKEHVEREALQRRTDLLMARIELEATARELGLTKATRYVTDLGLVAGVETERELEDGQIQTKSTAWLELDFAIPIFDSGAARMKKAEFTYMRAANRLAERAVNIRSEARSAYLAYRASHEIARHYRNSVLPLRTRIEEESLLTYNGMITNTFELLADTRARIGTVLLAARAKRDFWLAEAGLAAAIHGGGAPASVEGGGGEATLADAGGGH